ncbi:hypothetical protein [Deinococcus ficus]|uniref:Uncharacterized protein n=1 Tax=Deinococcus ficus TaxID=317577 RepID=A0A221T2K6_9DEIO|nr:hypothetical protein [Deinococcus ficus]ASN83138.1 hypothetical protein DFI_18225 [Deinococcus ficus]
MTAGQVTLPEGRASRAREIAVLTVHCALDTHLRTKALGLKAQGLGREAARQHLLLDVQAAGALIGIDAQDVHHVVCGGLLRAEGFAL